MAPFTKSGCVTPLLGAVARSKVLTPTARSTRGALLRPCWLIWSRTLTSVEGLHRRPRAVYKYWASYVVFFAFSRMGVDKVPVGSPQLHFFDRGRCARVALDFGLCFSSPFLTVLCGSRCIGLALEVFLGAKTLVKVCLDRA